MFGKDIIIITDCNTIKDTSTETDDLTFFFIFILIFILLNKGINLNMNNYFKWIMNNDSVNKFDICLISWGISDAFQKYLPHKVEK